MERKLRSEKFLRKRKLLLVMPLLVLPFLTIGFYALGGGKSEDPAMRGKEAVGLNPELPAAAVKEDANASKLSFYEKAAALQKEKEKEIQSDPYFRLMDVEVDEKGQPGLYSGRTSGADDAAEKIYEKISLLEKEINQPPAAALPEKATPAPVYHPQMATDVDRLQGMLQLLNEKPGEDPEMKKLEGMLDKILAIQRPERVQADTREKLVEAGERVFAVSAAGGAAPVVVLGNDTAKQNSRAGFYGAEDNDAGISSNGNGIAAVIHETRTVTDNAEIKFRLLHDIRINGQLIPKNVFVFGMANIQGQRLQITIHAIQFQHAILPVKLSVYDQSGIKGLYIAGAAFGEIARQSVDRNLQMMELTAVNPSVAVQAANAGIQTAKSLLAKKLKPVTVTVKAGTSVILVND